MLADSVLTGYKRWVLWRADKNPDGSVRKTPIHPQSLRPHDAHDPHIHMHYMDAASLAAQHGVGVGFVITAHDPFAFFDIDDCIDPATGQLNEIATNLLTMLPEAWREVSQSGQGLHIICSIDKSKLPADRACKSPLGFDLYTDRRFVAITGNHASGDPGEDLTARVVHIAQSWLTHADRADTAATEWTTGPVEQWSGPEDDDELIQLALRERPVFASLWNADEDYLRAKYPPDKARADGLEWDRTAADLALCWHLAHYTGKDCERMDRIFRASVHYREKWERYGRATVLRAVSTCDSVLGGAQHAFRTTPATVPTGATPATVPTGGRPLKGVAAAAEQAELFRGWIIIKQPAGVYVPGVGYQSENQINIEYGGYCYCLDESGRQHTRDAYKAAVYSSLYTAPRVDSPIVHPGKPEGEIVTIAGMRYVNVFRWVHPPQIIPGVDTTPFERFLALLVPDARDRDILTSYCASLFQNPGVKFRWAPLLVSELTGTGKGVLSSILRYPYGRFAIDASADRLAGKFNAWAGEKAFAVFNELKVADRMEMEAEIKTLTTEDTVTFERKGVEKATVPGFMNFLFSSNYLDAWRKTSEDRRMCIFVSPYKSRQDQAAAGMGGNYFPELIKWLNSGGYSAAISYLMSYPINPEFDPAGAAINAPVTSTQVHAEQESLSYWAGELRAAMDECRPGVCGGWISSVAARDLLGSKASDKALGKAIRELGYVPHPALVDGRSTRLIGGLRHRLYVHKDSHLALLNRYEVCDAYEAAQSPKQFREDPVAPPKTLSH